MRAINDFMKKFVEKKAQIYIVGGASRDLILKREVNDWDFTTDLTPEKIQEIFPKNSFYNNLFGTVSIVNKNKSVYEVTTFRTENAYSDKRHPDEVKWGKNIEEDLQRRDFTINAIAMDIGGKMIDPYEGQKDLQNKIIRTVGNADERFAEDALRMMRAIRIAAQLCFLIEDKTFEAIIKNKELLNNIAPERIRDELFKILKAKYCYEGVIMLKNSGLLKIIIPELLEGVEMSQKGHHIYDVWTHNLEALRNCQSFDPVTRLACLLHDVGKPVTARGEGAARTFHGHDVVGSRIALRIGKRLRLSNVELEQLFKLVRWHMFSVSEMQTDKAVRRFIKNVTVPYIDEMIALRRADRVGSGSKETSWRWELFKKRIIEVQKQPFTVKDLKINGLDVMKELNLKPGPEVGKILNNLFAKVDEDPKLNERSVLLELLKKENDGNGNRG